MTGITCSLRFPGQLNSDLRKLAVNLVPFPRQHFFTITHAPIASIKSKQFKSNTMPELIHQLYDHKNVMSCCDPRQGRYSTASAVFRGNIPTREIEESLKKLVN